MEKELTMRFPKLEATSVDEMIDKLIEFKQEVDATGEQVKSLFTIAVIGSAT